MLLLRAVLAAAVLASGDFESRRLAEIPEGANVIVPPVFSRDGGSVAFAYRSEGVDRVMRAGRRGAAFEFI